jgi:predicted ATPase
VGHARALAGSERAALARKQRLQEQIGLHERVAAALTRAGEERQDAAQRQVEELVTRGLQAIFDESLSFHLVQSVKGNQANVDFVIRNGELETPVLEARGGGMAAVVGFLLRLVVLLLTPGARRVLFLDESFAHVSAEYEPRLAEFIWEVCAEAGVQVILVTHSDAYSDLAYKVYRFALGAGGVTEVREP